MFQFTAIADNFKSETDDVSVAAVASANAATLNLKLQEKIGSNPLTPPNIFIFAKAFKNGNFNEDHSWGMSASTVSAQDIANAYEIECQSQLTALYGEESPDRVTIIIDIVIED